MDIGSNQTGLRGLDGNGNWNKKLNLEKKIRENPQG